MILLCSCVILLVRPVRFTVVMHLRIWIWLSCVVLAGYVRATEDAAVAESPSINLSLPLNDGVASDQSTFVDADEGSGLETDESSGSGWGAGPGPDDEDSSGEAPTDHDELPPDDEDYTTSTDAAPTDDHERKLISDFYDETEVEIEKESEQTDTPITPATPVTEPPPLEPEIHPEVFVPVNKPSGGEVEPHGAGEERPSRPDQNGEINISEEDTNPAIDQEQAGTNVDPDSRPSEVFIMNAKPEDRAISFFAQPGILAAVIGGAVVGLLCAILVVMFIVYRMRKKDEGSYALDEPKRSPAAASYGKGHNNREFYA